MNKLLLTIATLFAYSGLFSQTWNTGTGAWISPLSKNIGIQKSLQVGDNVGTDSLWCKTDLNYFEGNVGIGTITPEAKLHVSSNDTTGIEIAHFENNLGTAIITLHSHSDSSALYGLQTEDFNSALGLSGTTGEVILLTGLGSVAIEIDTTGITNVLQNLSISNGTTSQGKLYLVEDQDNGTNAITLKTPSALAASYDITLPANDGNANEVLTTNGSGVTSWTNNGSGVWTQISDSVIAYQNINDTLAILSLYDGTAVGSLKAGVDSFNSYVGFSNVNIGNVGIIEFGGTANTIRFKIGSSASKNLQIEAGTISLLAGTTTLSDDVIFETSESPLSGAACTQGQITWDANYIYVCTASGAWKRSALTGGY